MEGFVCYYNAFKMGFVNEPLRRVGEGRKV